MEVGEQRQGGKVVNSLHAMHRATTGTHHVTTVAGESVRAFIPSPLPPSASARSLRAPTTTAGEGDSRRGAVGQHQHPVAGPATFPLRLRATGSWDVYDDTRRTLGLGRGAPNALRVLAGLRQRPVLSLKQLCQTTAMNFPTASKALHTLVAAGIARELTGKRRNRVFVYDAYLAILNEGGEPL